MSGCEDVVAVLEEKQAPAILGMYSNWLDKPVSGVLARCMRDLAGEASVPVTVMLDHGKSPEQCRKALDMGFTDIMYDGSRLPLEENIRITREIVQIAHERGAGVEAELGHVGSGKDYGNGDNVRANYTEPEAAERFVAETGVDCLAVAIGTAHGVYDGEPRLDLDLLDRIAGRVAIPLVLHGGSGLSEEQFRDAIARGIAKVNIATDLITTAAANMKAAAQTEERTFFAIMNALHETLTERCGYYLDLFGADGKAQ